MLNKVTVKQKPSPRLNAYLFVCIIVIILAPAVSFAQDIPNQATASPVAVNGNPDLIVPLVGDNINCTIDRVDKTLIYYHIKKRGADPQGSVALTQVIKYFYKKQWREALVVSPSNVKARNLILAENINEAIASYAILISKDSTNATLLAEDAYALALGGIYEAALMRLDQSWSMGANSADVNYLTGQVFALMGYDEITNEVWKSSEKYSTPSWVASKATLLLEKYKTKNSKLLKISREELLAKFKLANDLASKSSYFRSIALFHQITNLYPNEYLPYVGYSIAMEKTGALNKSAQTIEKAISLVGNNAEDREKKQFLEQRLAYINQKMTLLPAGTLPGLSRTIVPIGELPQMMAYIGGMASPSFTNLNGRIGYFMTGASNASLDFGLTKSAGVSSTNLGLSFYERSKYSVYGAGFQLASVSGKTVYYLKLSVGLSIMNRVRTSSFDLFLDINYGMKKGDVSTYSLSVGKGIYFGKRK
jgi:tetratricopeptide (TPR) repeat protein